MLEAASSPGFGDSQEPFLTRLAFGGAIASGRSFMLEAASSPGCEAKSPNESLTWYDTNKAQSFL